MKKRFSSRLPLSQIKELFDEPIYNFIFDPRDKRNLSILNFIIHSERTYEFIKILTSIIVGVTYRHYYNKYQASIPFRKESEEYKKYVKEFNRKNLRFLSEDPVGLRKWIIQLEFYFLNSIYKTKFR